MKKSYFYLYLISLIILLALVVFYMLFIHVPYYNHNKEINNNVKSIVNMNNYVYDSYSNEYRGYETMYIIKVKDYGINKYVAYNENLEFIDEYSGTLIDKEIVIKAIKDKYNLEVEDLDIGYENNQFVYYTKYQDDNSLLYIYYSVIDGEFIKAVGIGE